MKRPMQADIVAAQEQEESVAPTAVPGGPINAPITWDQFFGALYSMLTDPAVMLPALVVILNWFQSSEPLTVRGAITVALLAIIAIYQGVLNATGNGYLQTRLRAMGQLKGGK